MANLQLSNAAGTELSKHPSPQPTGLTLFVSWTSYWATQDVDYPFNSFDLKICKYPTASPTVTFMFSSERVQLLQLYCLNWHKCKHNI